jgi:hypothetical protein
MSVVEIAERLALPKTTAYYWIKDLPLGRARRNAPGAGSRRMCANWQLLVFGKSPCVCVVTQLLYGGRLADLPEPAQAHVLGPVSR